MKKTFFFVLLILFLVMMTTTIVYGDSYTCSDVTTGTPTASQTQTCSNGTLQNGSAGELCPFSQTPCVQQTSTPQCPSGYSLSGNECKSNTPQGFTGSFSWSDNCTIYTVYGSGNYLDIYSNDCGGGYAGGQIYYNGSSFSGSLCSSAGGQGWCAHDIYGSGGNIYYNGAGYEYGGPVNLNSGHIQWNTSNGNEQVEIYSSGNSLLLWDNWGYGGKISYNSNSYYTTPTCPSGTTLVNGECVSPWTCPVSGNGGDSATCIEPSGSSTYYCSPYSCYTDSSGTNVSTTPVNATMPPTQTNNGTVTDSGCDGSVYLFPGTAMQCRSGGEQTAWQDCCNASTYLFGMLKCTTQEESVAKDLQYDTQYGANGYNNPNSYGGSGDAQYVGSYCSDKFLGLCLESMKVYCVFHSLLGLIIQEQGRAQLGIGFGSPHNPDCSGLTPTQFQELNFSNFDFTEYVTVLENKIKAGVINTNTLNQMQNYTTTITNQISNYENELSGVNP